MPELPELRRFDAEFFGLPPGEAAILDPQHRLLLETAWHALEAAGCSPEKSPGRIGVFVGAPQSAYLQQHLLPQRDQLAKASDLQLRLACDPEFLATRIAYKLNLTGPALNVATACSTGLVAVHLACRSLQSGECEVALAGAASVESPELCGYRFQEGWITSRDGHCRPFDAKAQGTVFGSGAGIIVLKALDRALADGDSISAIIRGVACGRKERSPWHLLTLSARSERALDEATSLLATSWSKSGRGLLISPLPCRQDAMTSLCGGSSSVGTARTHARSFEHCRKTHGRSGGAFRLGAQHRLHVSRPGRLYVRHGARALRFRAELPRRCRTLCPGAGPRAGPEFHVTRSLPSPVVPRRRRRCSAETD